MCGIVGAVGAVAPQVHAAVARMNQAQWHRGPDDGGEFSDGTANSGVVLGFRRLAILDLSSNGHQPMVDAVRGNVIVMNGEIYNFAELRDELKALGEVFHSTTDTEVALLAYGRFGLGFLQRLRGMFALAVYDPRTRQVVLARDRVGIKPLYFTTVQSGAQSTLLFSSEIRALLASDLVERRLNPQALSTYLWNGFVVGPETLIRGVQLLPAGAQLVVPLDQPEAAKLSSFAPAEKPQVLPGPEAVEHLDAVLRKTFAQHMVSDVPLGVFLSGGVDSSAMAALAVDAGRGPVRTFNIGFDEAAFDESVYARQVAQALGTEHIEFRLTQSRFQEGLDAALNSLDQPSFDGINTYFVSRAVREAGFTVALAGAGGDELFGGYRSFKDLPGAARVAGALSVLPASWVQGLARGLSRVLAGQGGEVPPQTRFGKLADVLATRGDPVAIYQVGYALYTQQFLSQLQSPDTLAQAPYGLSLATFERLSALAGPKLDLAAVSQLELQMFVGERMLRDCDAASMAASLELRVPLLDHEVLQAVAQVPGPERFAPLGSKALLRRLALKRVDPAIFDRRKSGFVLPIEVWAKDRLAGDIQGLFADRALVESLGLRPDALTKLFRAFQAGAPGLYWSRIWAPFVLLHWCKNHQVSL